MKFGLRVAFCLLLVAGTVTVKGSDPSDALEDNDNNQEAAVRRAKRGLGVFDFFRGKEASTTGPTKATQGNGLGFNLADALGPGPQSPKPAGGNGFGFNLEDALRPATKPTDSPTGGECQGNVVQKLSTVIENQNQQLRLLLQLLSRSTSRF